MKPQASPMITPPGGGDEQQLADRARQGDREAIAQLYNEHHAMVYRYVLVRVRQHELAEDLTSETFLRAIRRFDSFAWQGKSVGAWLVTIARNLITDHYKSSRVKRERLALPVDDGFSEEEQHYETVPSAEDLVLDAMAQEQVRELLASLPLAYRTVLYHQLWDGMDSAEIAERMNRPSVGAVKTMRFRAMDALRASARAEGVAA